MIINERMINEERLTFMNRLKQSKVGTSFNIYSGSKNYVVTQVSNDRFKVQLGKGWDKASDAYIKKCYIPGTEEVTRNTLQNFIRMINKKNGWRENINKNEAFGGSNRSYNFDKLKQLSDSELYARIQDTTNHDLSKLLKELVPDSKERQKLYNRDKKISRIVSEIKKL